MGNRALHSTGSLLLAACVALSQAGCPAFTSDDFVVEDDADAGSAGSAGSQAGGSAGAGGDPSTAGAGGVAGTGAAAGMPMMMLPPACTSACPDGTACNDASMCSGGACTSGACAKPTCSDTVKNEDETDVDCGGSCPACAATEACKVPNDCMSKLCQAGHCISIPQPPNCHDGIKNGQESDVDCGMAIGCMACADGKMCGKNPDCMSNKCSGGICQMKLPVGKSSPVGDDFYSQIWLIF